MKTLTNKIDCAETTMRMEDKIEEFNHTVKANDKFKKKYGQMSKSFGTPWKDTTFGLLLRRQISLNA